MKVILALFFGVVYLVSLGLSQGVPSLLTLFKRRGRDPRRNSAEDPCHT
jgi:hypothetical protein